MRLRHVALCLLLAACGDDSRPTPASEDTGHDSSLPDVGFDTSNDAAPDAQTDAANDVSDVTVPTDSDEDGLLDTEDNCPADANADQADRDRDGVGDICDLLPFVHAPANPADLDAIDEDLIPSNNSPDEGELYRAAFPLKFTGTVDNAIDGENDFDLVTFEVDRPTALLIHIESTVAMWPSTILVGVDGRNNTLTRVAFGPDVGQAAVREMFLPVPGKYSFLISDFRNFIQTAGNVGGIGYDYTLWVSEIPLPEPQPVTLPTAAIPNNFDGTLKTYRVNTTNLDALRVYANGVSLEDNAFHFPAISILEPDLSFALAHTSPGQVSDTNRVGAVLGLGGRTEVVVVEDHVQRFLNNSMSIDFQATTLFETENAQNANDTRESDLPWLVPGVGMLAVIEEPRNGAPDEDFFLFEARRGQMYRAVVTPDPGGAALQPDVEIGVFYEQGGSFFLSNYATSTPRLDGTTTLEYYFLSHEDGEAAVRVAHRPNELGGLEGGAAYGYTVELQTVTPPEPVTVNLPGEGAKEFEAGGVALFEFEAEAGQVVRGRIDDAGLFLDANVSTLAGLLLTTTYNDFTFRASQTGRYRVDMRDFMGRGTPAATPVKLSLIATDTTPVTLPLLESGTFNAPGTEKFFEFSAQAGQLLDLRTQAQAGLVEITVYDQNFEQLRSTPTNRLPFAVPADGNYTVGVTPYDDYAPDYDWTLSAQELTATAVTLPFLDAGTLDAAPLGRWYAVPVVAGTAYEARVTTSSAAFQPRLYAYTETLGYVDAGTDTMRFTAGADGLVYVHLYDANNTAGPDYDFDLSIQTFAPQTLALNTPTMSPLSGQPTVFALPAMRGLLDVRVTSADFAPTVSLLRGSGFDRVAEAVSVDGHLVWGDASNSPLWVLVEGGIGTFEITADQTDRNQHILDIEPNDAANPVPLTPPAAHAGALSAADAEDAWTFVGEAGDKVFAVTVPLSSSIYAMNASLRLVDADGNTLATDTGSGDGFYPALYGVSLPTAGSWKIVLNGTSNADYVLFVRVD